MSSMKSMCLIGTVVGMLLAEQPVVFSQTSSLSSGAQAWDANHDGVHTCDEWKSHLERLFTSADRNHDGHLDPSEFAAVRRADASLADADFGYFDENQDGKITRNEFVGKPSELILRYDRNGDCKVTPEELKPASNAPEGPKAPVRDRWH